MNPEQQAVFADENSPFFMTGGFYAIASLFQDQERLTDIFRTGEGMAWGDHHPILFTGTAKFFRPSYKTNLIATWIPALDGIQAKLEKGGRVADVGCGYGFSTVMMAEAFPKSLFTGFDFHAGSIEKAREMIRRTGIDNIRFETATAKEFPGENYDLVTTFDCLHDMGDPAGAARHVNTALAPDASWMIVEPFANDAPRDNLNPIGRVYYAFSAAVCSPSSLSQEVGLGLGAQAGEVRLREVVLQDGFTRFRRAAETPFNVVLETRP